MIVRNESTNAATGVAQAAEYDTVALTVTFTPPIDGVTTRAMTPDEVTYWSGYQAAVDAAANEGVTDTKLDQALPVLQTIIDTPNAAITLTGSNVAALRSEVEAHLRDALVRDKDLARTSRRLVRKVRRLFDGSD